LSVAGVGDVLKRLGDPGHDLLHRVQVPGHMHVAELLRVVVLAEKVGQLSEGLEPTEGHVVGHRAESGQGGMLDDVGQTPLATVLPEGALPPLDLGPERVQVLRASHSFELDPGFLDVDLVLDRQLLGAGEGEGGKPETGEVLSLVVLGEATGHDPILPPLHSRMLGTSQGSVIWVTVDLDGGYEAGPPHLMSSLQSPLIASPLVDRARVARRRLGERVEHPKEPNWMSGGRP
jgi:hypothetical protein